MHVYRRGKRAPAATSRQRARNFLACYVLLRTVCVCILSKYARVCTHRARGSDGREGEKEREKGGERGGAILNESIENFDISTSELYDSTTFISQMTFLRLHASKQSGNGPSGSLLYSSSPSTRPLARRESRSDDAKRYFFFFCRGKSVSSKEPSDDGRARYRDRFDGDNAISRYAGHTAFHVIEP